MGIKYDDFLKALNKGAKTPEQELQEERVKLAKARHELQVARFEEQKRKDEERQKMVFADKTVDFANRVFWVVLAVFFLTAFAVLILVGRYL